MGRVARLTIGSGPAYAAFCAVDRTFRAHVRARPAVFRTAVRALLVRWQASVRPAATHTFSVRYLHRAGPRRLPVHGTPAAGAWRCLLTETRAWLEVHLRLALARRRPGQCCG